MARKAVSPVYKAPSPAYKPPVSPEKSPQFPHELSTSPDAPKKKGAKKRKDVERMDRLESQLATITAMMAQQIILNQPQALREARAPADTPRYEPSTMAAPAAAMAAPLPPLPRSHVPPPPEAMFDEPGVAGHLAEALRNLEPSMGRTGGKVPNTYKPHMFIPIRFRAKKPNERDDLTFPLYVNGMTGIILNAMSDQASRPAAICRHLREVAEDVADRKWESVRRWSKAIFDRMERSEVTWDMYDEIQRERMKLSYSAPPPQRVVTICLPYNRQECPESDIHVTDDVQYRHVCGYCFFNTSGSFNPHPVKQCTTKKAHQTQRNPQPQHAFKQAPPFQKAKPPADPVSKN